MNKISFEDADIISCEPYKTLCGQEGVELYLSITANKVSIYLTNVELDSLSKLIEKGGNNTLSKEDWLKEKETLLDGYKRILEASDLEMRDGDLAREIAANILGVKR